MKILLVGSGGREHALALGLHADTFCTELHVAPGNPGIAQFATCHELDIKDNLAITELAKSLAIEFVVIGPEVPLVNGAADRLRAAGIKVFGPSKAAAQLEGSKNFAKEVMHDAGVPTAKSFTVGPVQLEIERALDTFGAPYVVKDDGLAAGKGVVVTSDRNEAIDHAMQCQRVVIEEYLAGPEISLFGISDGRNIIPMQPAQDFKRALDGDEGPNTGGMGAYSPLPWLPANFVEEVTEKIAQPTIDELKKRGAEFIGLLYCGLIVTERGIKVIEFNARFGDPETQVVLRRLQTNLAELLAAAAAGKLDNAPVAKFSEDVAVTVVLASEGYPVTAVEAREVTGIESAEAMDDVEVCKASPTGRVLSVVGTAKTYSAARALAYEGMSRISLQGSHYRSDIALKVAE